MHYATRLTSVSVVYSLSSSAQGENCVQWNGWVFCLFVVMEKLLCIYVRQGNIAEVHLVAGAECEEFGIVFTSFGSLIHSFKPVPKKALIPVQTEFILNAESSILPDGRSCHHSLHPRALGSILEMLSIGH